MLTSPLPVSSWKSATLASPHLLGTNHAVENGIELVAEDVEEVETTREVGGGTQGGVRGFLLNDAPHVVGEAAGGRWLELLHA